MHLVNMMSYWLRAGVELGDGSSSEQDKLLVAILFGSFRRIAGAWFHPIPVHSSFGSSRGDR